MLTKVSAPSTCPMLACQLTKTWTHSGASLTKDLNFVTKHCSGVTSTLWELNQMSPPFSGNMAHWLDLRKAKLLTHCLLVAIQQFRLDMLAFTSASWLCWAYLTPRQKVNNSLLRFSSTLTTSVMSGTLKTT